MLGTYYGYFGGKLVLSKYENLPILSLQTLGMDRVSSVLNVLRVSTNENETVCWSQESEPFRRCRLPFLYFAALTTATKALPKRLTARQLIIIYKSPRLKPIKRKRNGLLITRIGCKFSNTLQPTDCQNALARQLEKLTIIYKAPKS